MTTKTRSSGSRAGATAAGSTGGEAAPKRCRGSYRRQLATGRPGLAGIGPETRRCAAVILEVLAGVRTPTSAAAALSIRLPRYYLLEERAIQGLVSACAPRPKGRTVSTDRRLAQLERELATTRRELTRQQALARTAAVAVEAEVVAGPSLASPADTSCSALGEDGSPSCVVATLETADALGLPLRCAAAGPHGDGNADIISIENIIHIYNNDLIILSADDQCAAAASPGRARSGTVAVGAEVVAGPSLASPADTSCSALGEDGSPSCVVAAGCARRLRSPRTRARCGTWLGATRACWLTTSWRPIPAPRRSAVGGGIRPRGGVRSVDSGSTWLSAGSARAAGFSVEETADALNLPPRTLSHWCARFESDGLPERMRGRPPRCASVERRAAVTGFLEAHGPSLSLASLKAAYPDVTRAELRSLRIDYLARWRRRTRWSVASWSGSVPEACGRWTSATHRT